MVHLYLATRGPKYIRDMWLANMMSQTSDWITHDLKTGEPIHRRVQWNIKPIELWEVVIPKEALNEVLWYNGIKGDGQQCHDNIFKYSAKMLRVATGMKLKPIPKYNEEGMKVEQRLIFKNNFTIYGLGIKEDEEKDFPQWNWTGEAL